MLLSGQSKGIDGCTVPAFLIGDSAYPLLQWFMKPFPDNQHMTEEWKTLIIVFPEPGLLWRMPLGS